MSANQLPPTLTLSTGLVQAMGNLLAELPARVSMNVLNQLQQEIAQQERAQPAAGASADAAERV